MRTQGADWRRRSSLAAPLVTSGRSDGAASGGGNCRVDLAGQPARDPIAVLTTRVSSADKCPYAARAVPGEHGGEVSK